MPCSNSFIIIQLERPFSTANSVEAKNVSIQSKHNKREIDLALQQVQTKVATDRIPRLQKLIRLSKDGLQGNGKQASANVSDSFDIESLF